MSVSSPFLAGRSAANSVDRLSRVDVFAVDVAAGRIVAVKPLAAWAAHPAVRLLRRQQFAAFPHRVFLGGPISLVAPRLKISLSALRQKHPPRGFKIGAGLLEGRGRAVLLLARFRTR